jgi:hypothetical protein
MSSFLLPETGDGSLLLGNVLLSKRQLGHQLGSLLFYLLNFDLKLVKYQKLLRRFSRETDKTTQLM